MDFQIKRMTSSFKRAARIGMLSVFFLAPSIFADIVSMTMTTQASDLGPALGGVYTSPYEATIGTNTTPTQIICDDFFAHISLGQTWQANRTTFDESSFTASALSTLRWASVYSNADLVRRYKQVSLLSLQLLANIDVSPAQEEISYAIWSVFAPTAVDDRGFDAERLGRISKLVVDAGNTVDDLNSNWSGGARFTFYTPVSVSPYPQEFISVSTPESSAIPMLALNFGAVLVMSYFLRRRVVQSAN